MLLCDWAGPCHLWSYTKPGVSCSPSQKLLMSSRCYYKRSVLCLHKTLFVFYLEAQDLSIVVFVFCFGDHGVYQCDVGKKKGKKKERHEGDLRCEGNRIISGAGNTAYDLYRERMQPETALFGCLSLGPHVVDVVDSILVPASDIFASIQYCTSTLLCILRCSRSCQSFTDSPDVCKR